MTGPSGREIMEAIRAVAEAACRGGSAITYKALGLRLGRPEQVAGRGLRHVFEAATKRCHENNLPDIAPSVVTAESLKRGVPMPSDAVFGTNGFWESSALHREDVAEAQSKVLVFDWVGVGVVKPTN